MKNHYNVLELDKNCTAKEIKDSYIKLSKKYHPDKNKSIEAKNKIIEINEAYSVLKNTSTRYQYDERLQRDSMQPRNQENIHQPRGGFSTRFYSYDEYVQYQKSYGHMNSQAYAEPAFSSRKFTAVICCCMLMVFGAGLRVMYAWSEAHRRKRYNEMTAIKIAETKHSGNPKVEEIRLMFQRKQERELERKKSES